MFVSRRSLKWPRFELKRKQRGIRGGVSRPCCVKGRKGDLRQIKVNIWTDMVTKKLLTKGKQDHSSQFNIFLYSFPLHRLRQLSRTLQRLDTSFIS